MAFELRKPIFNKMKDVEPLKRYNLIVKVFKVESVTKIKRIDADPIDMAICIVGDETGCAKILFKNAHVQFAKVNESIILRNVQARMIKERLRLEVDIWGKVEVSEVYRAESCVDSS